MPRRSTRVVSKSVTSAKEPDLKVDPGVSSHKDNEFARGYLGDVDDKSANKTLKKRKKTANEKQSDSIALQKVEHFKGIRGKLRQLP